LFVTDYDAGTFTNTQPALESTALGGDDRRSPSPPSTSTISIPATAPRASPRSPTRSPTTSHAPDILSIEEMQDNNGAAAGDGISPTGTDASTTWQMLVDALNLAPTGAHYQWVDQAPVYNSEGGEPSATSRVGFIYNTDRVQLGDLAPDATLAERREYVTGSATASATPATSSNLPTTCWAPRSTPTTGATPASRCSASSPSTATPSSSPPTISGQGRFGQLLASSTKTLENGEPNNSGWAQRKPGRRRTSIRC